MKTKIIALCLVLGLLAVAVVGGTMAYFTDADNADNEFTVGTIGITLLEDGYEDTSKYQDWLDSRTILPSETITKAVTVRNDSTTDDAYVRVTITVPKELIPNWAENYKNSWDVISTNQDGNNTVYVLGYKTPLAAGDVTPACLASVTMDKYLNQTNVTSPTLKVPVKVEAIQTVGFDTREAAFAALDAQNIVDNLGGAQNVADGDALKDVLDAGGYAVLTDDVTEDADESNAYGKTGVNQTNGGVIDGDGNTLSVPDATATWDSAINTTGGTIKNLTIDAGFRGIFINHNSTNASRVYLENVIIDGPTYTISCDQGTNNGLTATDCTFNGWTSYAATLGDALFINCKFGAGAGYNFSRPYAPTAYVGCDFATGHVIDPRAAVTFENCTINGVPLTADNLSTLVTSNIANATVK